MDQSENVGSFHPVEITAVHALDVPGSRPPMSESIPAEVDAAIAKMIPGVEDIMGEETEQLTDIGGTDKLQHVINTEAPPQSSQILRRLPFSRHQEVREMVDRILHRLLSLLMGCDLH